MSDAFGKNKLCRRLEEAIFDAGRELLQEINISIESIAARNYLHKFNLADDRTKNILHAKRALNGNAFIFEDNVYPEEHKLRVSQKGVAAFLLEDSLHDEMREVLDKLNLISKDDKMRVRQYIARSVGFATSMDCLKKLFPINYHGAIDKFTRNNGNPYKYDYDFARPALDIEKFKADNKSGLDVIKVLIVRKMLSA
jgi:hypothetical protein